jgi:hypothetical protein
MSSFVSEIFGEGEFLYIGGRRSSIDIIYILMGVGVVVVVGALALRSFRI